jgi:hypothetical protein
MNQMKAEKHLSVVAEGLFVADVANERREYMNALLRIIAMICYESNDPQRSYEIACAVIQAAMDEPDVMEKIQ